MSFDVLKAFVIGSSALTFVPFVLAVSHIPESKIDLPRYAINASLYFGAMNAGALIFGRMFGLSLLQRMVAAWLVSVLIIWTAITIGRPYAFQSQARWTLQYLLVLVAHGFTFLVTLYWLDRIFGLK